MQTARHELLHQHISIRSAGMSLLICGFKKKKKRKERRRRRRRRRRRSKRQSCPRLHGSSHHISDIFLSLAWKLCCPYPLSHKSCRCLPSELYVTTKQVICILLWFPNLAATFLNTPTSPFIQNGGIVPLPALWFLPWCIYNKGVAATFKWGEAKNSQPRF